MSVRLSNLVLIIFYAVLQSFGFYSPALATPKPRRGISHLPKTAQPKSVTFYSPIDTAKTIQVHEVLSEAQKSEQGLGRLVQTASLTIRFQAGYNPSTKLDESRYRIDMTESNPPEPASYDIFDGKQELVVKRGKVTVHETTEELNSDQWAEPLDEFIGPHFAYHNQHTQEAITAVLAVRNGQKVLVTDIPGGSEDWYDPKTHLLIRRTEFESQFGENIEASRTVYSGWILNAPLPVSTFAFPAGVPIPIDKPCPCPPDAAKKPVADKHQVMLETSIRLKRRE